MRKVLIITGPTASGKTNFSLQVSNLLPSSLIGADSVQVYKGLDIVSGKDIPEGSEFKSYSFPNLSTKFSLGYYLIDSTSLWMVDVVEPTYSFNVHDYVSCTIPIVEKSFVEEKLPIIVGGTGLYIRALLDGIETSSIAPNISLREELSEKDLDELHAILKTVNIQKFTSLNESDRKNKRRLIRAIEIAYAKPTTSILNKLENVEVMVIALSAPREVITKRIDERVEARLAHGAIDEAKKLFKNYDSLSPQVKNANGYKQIFAFLKNEISQKEMIEQWKRAEQYNAKKQMTWLKKDERVKWFDITENDFAQGARKYIVDWYTQK